MEEATFKKDETPYLIFRCTKCKQYMYVKITQKGKKCLRCGKNHTVSKILKSGEIVKGMTTAVEEVKKKQNELGISEVGHMPEFRAFGDFKVSRTQPKTIQLEINDTDQKQEDDFSHQFKKMLKEISSTYKKFPDYVLEVMADNYGIPHSQVKLLKKLFQKEGILEQLDNKSYRINL